MNINSSKEGLSHIRNLEEIRSLNELYELEPLDPSCLREVLMRVASKIVWYPENGRWRCVAIISLDDSCCMYMFFPWILPSAKMCETRLNEEISVCTTGKIEKEVIVQICKKVHEAFRSALCLTCSEKL